MGRECDWVGRWSGKGRVHMQLDSSCRAGTRNHLVVMGTQQEIVQFTDDDDDDYDDDVCNSVIGDDDGGKRHFNTGGAISLQQ